MCGSRRRIPRGLPAMAFPMLGEKGLMMLKYVGQDDPDTWYGEITNAPYPFDKNPTLYVDSRDAVFLLGPDFSEAQ